MAHLSRVWMAASVAVVQGRSEGQGAEWRAGLRHLHLGGRWPCALSPAGPVATAGTRPASAAGDGRDPRGGGDERVRQAEEAVKKAMFVSCWTPS